MKSLFSTPINRYSVFNQASKICSSISSISFFISAIFISLISPTVAGWMGSLFYWFTPLVVLATVFVAIDLIVLGVMLGYMLKSIITIVPHVGLLLLYKVEKLFGKTNSEINARIDELTSLSFSYIVEYPMLQAGRTCMDAIIYFSDKYISPKKSTGGHGATSILQEP